MGTNNNRGFARFLAALVLVLAVGGAIAAMPDTLVQPQSSSQMVDRSRKADSLRARPLNETVVAPNRSNRTGPPVRSVPGPSAIV
jgi:hypothetical protein